MGFGVLVHRSDSIYDDSPAERYQFPSQYLSRVERCVGDWIVYYEPTKTIDTRGYFAVAKIERVIPDPTAPEMYLALIEPGTYLDFAYPVPFKDPGGPVERGVLNEHGKMSGRAQSAVRPLSSDDFTRIVGLGLQENIVSVEPSFSFQDGGTPFVFDQPRERSSFTVSRIVRDRIFRQVVLRAYDQRCAITGLKFINGGGRAEAAAAHIQPVESRWS